MATRPSPGCGRGAPPDVVLMDVNMPGLTGYRTTQLIRQIEGPAGRVPILAMTADAMPAEVAECRAAGMDGHVAKPLDRAALRAALAPFMAGTGDRAACGMEAA